eukprot:5848909-Prymnesium_polylepis.1
MDPPPMAMAMTYAMSRHSRGPRSCLLGFSIQQGRYQASAQGAELNLTSQNAESPQRPTCRRGPGW